MFPKILILWNSYLQYFQHCAISLTHLYDSGFIYPSAASISFTSNDVTTPWGTEVVSKFNFRPFWISGGAFFSFFLVLCTLSVWHFFGSCVRCIMILLINFCEGLSILCRLIQNRQTNKKELLRTNLILSYYAFSYYHPRFAALGADCCCHIHAAALIPCRAVSVICIATLQTAQHNSHTRTTTTGALARVTSIQWAVLGKSLSCSLRHFRHTMSLRTYYQPP